jgi:hypothetical protein
VSEDERTPRHVLGAEAIRQRRDLGPIGKMEVRGASRFPMTHS